MAPSYPVFQPCGTCRMGRDPKEAESSLFPTVTSSNINAPTIMIGERRAEFLLHDMR
jgi:choline dehydrogenase